MNTIASLKSLSLPQIKHALLGALSKLGKIASNCWVHFAVVLTLTLISVVMYQVRVRPYRNVDQLKEQAVTAADPSLLNLQIRIITLEMGRLELTQGYVDPIFKPESKNLSIVYQNLNALRDQAEVLSHLSPASEAYHTGVDSIHDTLYRMYIGAEEFYQIRSVWFWILCVGFSASLGFFIRAMYLYMGS